jgi:hypothetical protein
MYSWCLKSLVRWQTDWFVAVKDGQSTFVHVLHRKLARAQGPEERGKGERAGDQRNGNDDNGNREQGHEERCGLRRKNIAKNMERNKR